MRRHERRWAHVKVMSRWRNLSSAWGLLSRSCRQRRHITEHKGCAPRGHKLVGCRCSVTVSVQQGDTVRVGRPTPIEGGMTDVRIAEIDQADKFEYIWLYKGMDRPGVRVQRHQVD